MQFKTLTRNPTLTLHTQNRNRLAPLPARHNAVTSLNNHCFTQNRNRAPVSSSKSQLLKRRSTVISCISSRNEVIDEIIENPQFVEEGDNDSLLDGFGSVGEAEAEAADLKRGESANRSIWKQMKEIVMFSGPATGLWICSPLMSLIDTAVIGQGSSLELAALGPGTVLCDNMSFVFMFLSIATSNIVATALVKKDKKEVQHQISMLLCVGLVCGIFMLLFTKFFGTWALTAFAGAKNAHIVPAANKYVQIRGLAWPAILIGWVAQSSSLGMKDSWGPLKSLVVASTVNIIGHVVLCTFLGYGITGAAWATMVSQVIAAYMMVQSLNAKGYNAYAITVPSPIELFQIIKLAAPVFVMQQKKREVIIWNESMKSNRTPIQVMHQEHLN